MTDDTRSTNEAAQGATQLTDVLAEADAQGFTREFDVAGDAGALRCPQCSTLSEAGEFDRSWSRRLEGASDPADMLHVSAITCPACGARGVFISPFGPAASASQAAVLRALPEP
jgi:hypothetical protein